MAFSLLSVGEHLSLEFDTSDLEALRSYIRDCYPDMSSRAAGIATVVTFGGEDFTFQNEWDDPCLISSSGKGDQLLRAVHTHFFSESDDRIRRMRTSAQPQSSTGQPRVAARRLSLSCGLTATGSSDQSNTGASLAWSE